MADSSWDNGGVSPKKQGLGTGMKVLLGCGVALLLGIVTCTVGGLVLGRMIKKDPDAFERRVEGWAKGLIQKDWDRLRSLVDQLQTDEGAKTVYGSNPDLRQTHPAEESFLNLVRGWRARLSPLPVDIPEEGHRHHARSKEPADDKLTPEPAKTHSVNVNKLLGTTTIVCRYPDGTRLEVTFRGDRIGRIEVE